MKQFTAGDLLQVIVNEHGWSLCCARAGKDKFLSECPAERYDSFYDPPFRLTKDGLEGKLALVVQVKTNKLNQPLTYELQIGEKKYFCKAILAQKYLLKV